MNCTKEENRPESDSDGLNRAGMKTPRVITLTLTLIGKFKSSFWVLSVWMIIFCVLVVKTLEGEQLSHLCSSFLQIVPDHIAGTSAKVALFLQPRVYWWHTFKTVLVFPAILMISVHNQRWFIDYTEEDVARVSKTKLSKKKPKTLYLLLVLFFSNTSADVEFSFRRWNLSFTRIVQLVLVKMVHNCGDITVCVWSDWCGEHKWAIRLGRFLALQWFYKHTIFVLFSMNRFLS